MTSCPYCNAGPEDECYMDCKSRDIDITFALGEGLPEVTKPLRDFGSWRELGRAMATGDLEFSLGFVEGEPALPVD